MHDPLCDSKFEGSRTQPKTLLLPLCCPFTQLAESHEFVRGFGPGYRRAAVCAIWEASCVTLLTYRMRAKFVFNQRCFDTSQT